MKDQARNLLAVVTLFAFPASLVADDAATAPQPSVTVGSRVHIKAPTVLKGPITGSIVSIDESSLALQTKNGKTPLVVPLQAVSGLEVSRGRRSRGRWAGRGAAAGAGALAILGYATGEDCPQSQDGYFAALAGALCTSHGEGAAIGFFLGAPLGALIGLMIPPGERWQRTSPDRVRVSIGPAPHGIGASVSLAF